MSLFWFAGIAEAQNVLAQDTAKCFQNLMEADANGDFQLDHSEYVSFLRIYGVPNIGDSYQDLPLVLQSTFYSISCICTTNGSETQSCCYGLNPFIPIDGASTSQLPTQAQEVYLGKLCGLTDSAASQIIPTDLVTETPSSSPSNLPSQNPTSHPSVPSPPMVTKIQTQYTIAIANGRADQINPEWFTEDLISAMDVVATDVGIMVEDGNETRRRLTVTVGLPTSIVEFEEKEWSNEGSSGESIVCLQIFLI